MREGKEIKENREREREEEKKTSIFLYKISKWREKRSTKRKRIKEL